MRCMSPCHCVHGSQKTTLWSQFSYLFTLFSGIELRLVSQMFSFFSFHPLSHFTLPSSLTFLPETEFHAAQVNIELAV